MTDKSQRPSEGQFLVYQTEDGKLKIDVRFEGETVWLAQQQMAELFQTTKQNISLHIRNTFSEGELREDSVVKESLITQLEGTQPITPKSDSRGGAENAEKTKAKGLKTLRGKPTA